jgi:hypothetical protein
MYVACTMSLVGNGSADIDLILNRDNRRKEYFVGRNIVNKKRFGRRCPAWAQAKHVNFLDICSNSYS